MKRDITLDFIALTLQSWISAAVNAAGVYPFILNTLYSITPLVGVRKSDLAN